MTIPEARATLGWSRYELASRTGYGETTVRKWEAGKIPMPADVAEWLERLARHHEANPAPGR